jgi:hypothetical protein
VIPTRASNTQPKHTRLSIYHSPVVVNAHTTPLHDFIETTMSCVWSGLETTGSRKIGRDKGLVLVKPSYTMISPLSEHAHPTLWLLPKVMQVRAPENQSREITLSGCFVDPLLSLKLQTGVPIWSDLEILGYKWSDLESWNSGMKWFDLWDFGWSDLIFEIWVEAIWSWNFE